MKRRFLILPMKVLMIQLAAMGISCCSAASDSQTIKGWDTPANPIASSGPAMNSIANSITDEATNEEINRESPFGIHPAYILEPAYNRNPYRDAQYIGIKWHRPAVPLFWFLVQPNISTSRLDFSSFDRLYGDVPKGISIMVNIAPEGPKNENHARPGSYLPIDSEKYRSFVKAAVERYDGDGKDDMPGLKNPILHWQVYNEPSVTIKKDFSTLQLMTYTAIKETCPNCQVLIGGVAHPILQFGGEFETNPDRYFNYFSANYEPILRGLNGKGFDIFDFHWMGTAGGDYKKIKPIYEELKARLKKYNFGEVETWITEMSSYSGTPRPSGPLGSFALQTERDQAADLLKRYVFSLSLGIRKIFAAFGLMEGFMKDGGYFDHTGLIYDGRGANDPGMGIKKLSYYTYRKMTETLGGSDSSRIETIQAEDEIFIFKFLGSVKPIWVCWNDRQSPQSVKIPLPKVVQNITITEAVPKYKAGKDVTDYDHAFDEIPWKFIEGDQREVEFLLGSTPVFIEEKRFAKATNVGSCINTIHHKPHAENPPKRDGRNQLKCIIKL